jgi:hypothetical protein
MHPDMIAALEDEVSGAHVDLEHNVIFPGEFDQLVVVDRLDVAAAAEGNRRAAVQFGRRKRILRAPELGREDIAGVLGQVVRSHFDDGVGENGPSDLVQIEKKRDEADDGEGAANGDGDVRNVVLTKLIFQCPQHDQHVENGAEERARERAGSDDRP